MKFTHEEQKTRHLRRFSDAGVESDMKIVFYITRRKRKLQEKLDTPEENIVDEKK